MITAPASPAISGAITTAPVICFLHIPKTAGSTLRAWMENHLPEGHSLVLPEQAPPATPRDLEGRALLSGHYSGETLRLVPRCDALRLAVVRDPFDRFASWAAHSARLHLPGLAYRAAAARGVEVFDQPHAHELFQSHWLHRAVRGDDADTTVPRPDELPGLLAEVDLIGVTEQLDRFMQLVAFTLGWPPPPADWRINRAPQPHRPRPDADQIRERLDLDRQLHELATAAFTERYAEMLRVVMPDRSWTGEDALQADFGSVQTALRAHFAAGLPETRWPTDTYYATADAPLLGEGWWWREKPGEYAYRWSGPEPVSTLHLPPFVDDRPRLLFLEFMAVASGAIWDSLELRWNGVTLPVTRRFLAEAGEHEPKFIATAELGREHFHRSEGNVLELRIAQPVRALSHVLVSESMDTVNPDTRAVGVCLHSVGVLPEQHGG